MKTCKLRDLRITYKLPSQIKHLQKLTPTNSATPGKLTSTILTNIPGSCLLILTFRISPPPKNNFQNPQNTFQNPHSVISKSPCLITHFFWFRSIFAHQKRKTTNFLSKCESTKNSHTKIICFSQRPNKLQIHLAGPR
jgi:hypothetical protein